MTRLLHASLGLLLLLHICYSTLNLKELKDVIYDVAIDETPAADLGGAELDNAVRESWSSLKIQDASAYKDSLVITSGFGQQFICPLPSHTDEEERETPEQKHFNISSGLVADVLSASFFVQECIRKKAGWWTYELCYEKSLKQFHQEDANTIGVVLSLGSFGGVSEVPSFVAKADQPLYLEQQFTGGSICDITGKPRKASVRYFCDELLPTSEAYIESVDERASCEYLLVVKCGSLCKLKEFLPVDRPRTSLNITCKPLLTGKEVELYAAKLAKDREEKEAMKAKIDDLVDRAYSVQRQRFARRRTTLNSPKEKRIAASEDKILKEEYEKLMRHATQLSIKLEGLASNTLDVVFDDIDDMEDLYWSDADEDRGNLYWYFNDPLWKRSFFPKNIAYIRARNNYFTLMSRLFEEAVQPFDSVEHFIRVFSYEFFLDRIDSGELDERYLRLTLRSTLTRAFQEYNVPGIADFVDGGFTVDDDWYDMMWLDSDIRDKYVEIFEIQVLKGIVKKDKFTAEDVMSKVARQILHTYTLLKEKEKNDESFTRYTTVTYLKAAEIYKQFEKAYDRAVKRYDKYEHISRAEGLVGRSLTREELISWMDMVKSEEMDEDNAKLLVKNPLEVVMNSKEDTLWHQNLELLLKDKSEAEKAEINKRVMSEYRETAAKKRLAERGKRPNLRQKVEEYFRRPSPEELKIREKAKQADSFDEVGWKKQVEFFRESVERRIRESGIAGGKDVKVEILPANLGKGKGMDRFSTFDSKEAIELLSLLAAEHDAESTEVERYKRLWNGYAFGANEKQRNEGLEKPEEDKSSDLLGFLAAIRRDMFA